jgi:hypothetical protein
MSSTEIGRAGDLGVTSADVRLFYQQHWQRRIALGHEAFYVWQFVDTPINPGLDECVVAVCANRLAGVMGVNSRPFRLNGEWLPGAELTTWVVSSEFQGRGIGPAIIRDLMLRYEVLMGAGITADALPIYLRHGFKFLRHIPRFVRILDRASIKEYAKIELLAGKLADQRLHSRTAAACEAVPVEPGEWDNVFLRFTERHSAFDRRGDWADWRYGRHPHFKHQTLCLRGPAGRKVLLCMRTDVLPNGAKILRIIDLFGDTDLYPSVLAYLDRYALENGYALADCFCTHAPLRAHMAAHGWFSTLDEPFFQFPHLFSPIELREPATTSLILWSKYDLACLLDHSALHVTKQDCDLDRPTMEDLEP